MAVTGRARCGSMQLLATPAAGHADEAPTRKLSMPSMSMPHPTSASASSVWSMKDVRRHHTLGRPAVGSGSGSGSSSGRRSSRRKLSLSLPRMRPKHRDDSGYDTDEEVVSFVDLHKSDNEVAHRYQKESFARIRQLARTYADANETANGGGDANDASSSDAYDEASNTLSGTDHHSLHTSFRSASSKRLSKRTSPPHSHSSKPSVSVSMSYSVSMSSKSSESKDSNGSGSGSSGGTQILRSSPKGGVGGNSLQRGAPPLPPSSQKKAKNLTLTRSGATAALTKRAHHSHSRKSSRDRRRDKV